MIFISKGTLESTVEKAIKSALGVREDSDSTIEGLNKKIRSLKDEVADLKTKKKMEEREMAHLVKMKEEKNTIDYQKKENELENQFNKKEMQLQTEYHDKILGTLEKHKNEFREIQKELIARLPNVNMEIKR